jgi:uncharacterized protein (DUF302 family)
MIPASASGNAGNAGNAGNGKPATGADTTCERAYELLGRLSREGVDGDADAALIEEIADHFDNCVRCHDEEELIEELVALYKSVSATYDLPLPPSLEERLLDAMCGRGDEHTQHGRTGEDSNYGSNVEGEDMDNSTIVQQLYKSPSYGFGTTLSLPVEKAVERVTAALKEEGFGVLTTIDVKQTMKQKLDVDFEPYFILGACNPPLAHRALQAVHDIGLLLPCNVIVHAHGEHGEQTRVDIADPIAMLGIVQAGELEEIAREASTRLRNVLQRLKSSVAGAE